MEITPNNLTYLHCPKCENIMRLQKNYDSPMPSGTTAGTATPLVNSTGTMSSNQIWRVYYCPKCGETTTTYFQFLEPER